MKSTEQMIVGYSALDAGILRTCRNAGLKPEHFGDKSLSLLFAAECAVYDELGNVDLVTIEEREAALADALETAIAYTNSQAAEKDVLTWCKSVMLQSCRAELKTALNRAETALNSKSALTDVIRDVKKAVSAAENITDRRKISTLDELAAEAALDASECGKGKSNIPYFADGTQGRAAVCHRLGQIAVISAFSGTGKTEFSLSATVKPCLEAGKRVVYICLESVGCEILERFAGIMAGVPYAWVAQGRATADQLAKWAGMLKQIMEQYRDRLFIFGDESGVSSAAAIDAELSRIENQFGAVDLLVIDFLQRMERPADVPTNGTEYQVVSANMDALHRITAAHNVATLVNCQLNRTGGNSRPDKFRLAGSGKIEHLAHNLFFLHQQDGKTRLYSDKTRNSLPFDIEVNFSKCGYLSKKEGY